MSLNDVRVFKISNLSDYQDVVAKISTIINVTTTAILREIFSAREHEKKHLDELGNVKWESVEFLATKDNRLIVFYETMSKTELVDVKLVFFAKDNHFNFYSRKEKPKYSHIWR